jgi:hypothetical protein
MLRDVIIRVEPFDRRRIVTLEHGNHGIRHQCLVPVRTMIANMISRPRDCEGSGRSSTSL